MKVLKMNKTSRGICLPIGMKYYPLSNIKFTYKQKILYIATRSYTLYIKK